MTIEKPKMNGLNKVDDNIVKLPDYAQFNGSKTPTVGTDFRSVETGAKSGDCMI
jgi:hypothetical protein